MGTWLPDGPEEKGRDNKEREEHGRLAMAQVRNVTNLWAAAAEATIAAKQHELAHEDGTCNAPDDKNKPLHTLYAVPILVATAR